jgi:hypothetical protein
VDAQDPEVAAWAQQLVEKLSHPNETIRASAQEALVRLGSAAHAPLKALADTPDAPAAKHAREVLARMDQRRSGGSEADRRGPMVVPQDALNAALKAASVTPEQESKVRAAFEEQKKRIQDLYAQGMNGALSKEEVRAAMRGIEQESAKALRGLLDDTQFEAFMESFKKLRGPMRKRLEGDK